MRPRKFRVHFNRVNMQRESELVWTIHLSDRCIPAKEVIMAVPVATVFRPNGPQPRAWFSGYGFVKDLGKGVWGIYED